MPNLDGTGPFGQGKMSGRKMGACAGGVGGNRMGRGNRCRWTDAQSISLSEEDQLKVLEARLKEMDVERSAIEKKLKDLKK
ncbi:DUF5320 domain-containing protein [Candidatus Micrarchaeota archaeon]|nr:DUF5320 domain-containing protein [Candidatus Micrarchaeota archaeon]